MARALPTAADAASRWQAGFSAAGPRWAAGIQAVTTAPGVAAAAAVDRYTAGVMASSQKYASRVAAVTLQQWKDVSVQKGQGRLQSGAQAGLAKYQSGIQKVLDAQRSIIPGLPPRGSVAQNIARSSAFQQAMHDAFSS